MWQAYVGIVSNERGLEVFCLDDPANQRLLWSRFGHRPRPRAGCFWAVLADDSAERVWRSLRRGRARAAWELLQRDARELGTLLPSDHEPAKMFDSPSSFPDEFARLPGI